MTDDDTDNKRTGIQPTLDALQDEIERLERQTTADSIDIEDVTDRGSAIVRLRYMDLTEGDA